MKRGAFVALALVAALAAFAPALAPGRALVGRDLPHLFFPLGRFVARAAAREGNLLPRRDPTRALGLPLVPDALAESFYPGRLVRVALPDRVGLTAWLVLHAALCGVGAAALARACGSGTRGAALAAVAATLSGPILSLHRHPNVLAGTGLATLALAALVRGGARAGPLAGGAIGLALLAGGMEPVLGLALPVAALVLGGEEERGRRAAAAGLAFALGAALAAAQLFPTAASLPETGRPGAVPRADALVWSTHPLRLVETAAPGACAPWSEALEGNAFGEPLLASLYLTPAVLVLAALGARYRAPLGVGVLLLVLAACGRFGGLIDVLRLVPGFDRFRYPEKLLGLAATIAAALAGLGLDRAPPARAARALVGLGVALALGAALEGVVPALAGVRQDGRAAASAALLHGALRGALAAVAAAAVLALAPRSRRVALAALAGLVALDLLGAAGGRVVPTGPARWLEEPPATARAIAAAGLDGRVLSGPGMVGLRGDALPQEPEAAALAPVLAHREGLLGGHAGLHGLEEAFYYGAFPPVRLHALFALGSRSPDLLADLASIGAVVLPAGSDFAPRWPRFPVPGTGIVVAAAPAGPRARLVLRATPARGLDDARAALEGAFDPRAEAVVEGLEAPLAEPGPVEAVRAVERTADRIEVAFEPATHARRVLVLSELFTRGGFVARADGREVPVLAADVALLGVPLPAGTRSVVLEARTPGLAAGAVVSAFGLAALVALLWRGKTPRGGASST